MKSRALRLLPTVRVNTVSPGDAIFRVDFGIGCALASPSFSKRSFDEIL